MNNIAMGFTRGPWVFLEEGCTEDGVNRCAPLTICSPDAQDLANVYSSDDASVSIPRSQAIANARLIASAPALIDALQTVIRQCGERLTEASGNIALLSHAQLVIAQAAGSVTPEQPPKHTEGYLCRAWGETDLPEARLVRTADEWKAFVVEAQWGPNFPYRVLDDGDREMVDAQVRYIEHDMADNNEGQINFEIGGVSVERVTFLAPPA